MNNLKWQKKANKSNSPKNSIYKSKATQKAFEIPLFPFQVNVANTHYFFIGTLATVYLIMLFIVNPIGNFPLNDDWIYAKPVLLLLTEHIYTVPDVCSPILVFQPFLGALFCLFTGFSFTTLRILVLLLSLTGVFVFYFLMYDLSKNKKLAFLASLLLLINPIYFNLSNTFMTDIPFLTMSIFSIFFFVKYISTSQTKFLLLATLISIFATLIRQFGLFIPIAFGVFGIIREKKNVLNKLFYITPTLITGLILKITLIWLKRIGSNPVLSNNTSILNFFSDPKFWSLEVITRCGNVLFYFGLLFFPFLLFIKISSFKSLNSFSRKSSLILLLIISALFIHFYNGFPHAGIINSGSVGPRTLSDIGIYGIDDHYTDDFSDMLMLSIYAMGNAGAILLLINLGGILLKLIRHIKTPVSSIPLTSHKKIFIAICGIGYLILFIAPFDHFDRYMLPLFALICLILTSETRTNKVITIPAFIFSSIYISLLVIFSAFATHDYIAWNRARWQAVNYLTNEQHISIHKIDGGYEVNGWLIGTGRELNKQKLWACVDDNTYMLSFGEINGCRTVKQFYYRNYFPKATRYIYVLQTKDQ